MQEQKKFKYVYNWQEVSKEEFEKLSGEAIKWFKGNSIFSVPFSSFGEFFDGDYKSQRQINEHLKCVLSGQKTDKGNNTRYKAKEEGKFHKYPLTPEECFVKDDLINSINRGEKEMMEEFNKIRKCSTECFCDGSCKKVGNLEDINRPTKPNPFNQSNFHKEPTPEKTAKQFKEHLKNIEGVKESQSVKKAPIFTYCKQMKNAIEQLAFRSEYGHNKYLEFDADWQNFARVENGDEEYGNAQFRHALGIGEDTELEHYVASAWDAVARLEIYLRKNLHN